MSDGKYVICGCPHKCNQEGIPPPSEYYLPACTSFLWHGGNLVKFPKLEPERIRIDSIKLKYLYMKEDIA
jgi:hypothetical protein